MPAERDPAEVVRASLQRCWDCGQTGGAVREAADQGLAALASLVAEVERLRKENEHLRAVEGLPPDLVQLLRDPTITIPRDHEIRLADGRTLFEHLHDWQNAPSNTASAELPLREGEEA